MLYMLISTVKQLDGLSGVVEHKQADLQGWGHTVLYDWCELLPMFRHRNFSKVLKKKRAYKRSVDHLDGLRGNHE
jgi:hypothetical protein